MNVEFIIAAVLTCGMVAQLWIGVVLLPRRSWYERWLHDEDAEDTQVWRSYEPVKYWLIVAVECAAIAFLWWRGITGNE